MDDDQKKQVLDLLAANKLAVISTLDAGQPQSALIGFAEDDSLNIHFQTKQTTRKAQNLETNQRVSFVIGTNVNEPITLQYEGIAKPLSKQEAEEAKPLFVDKDSPSVRFFDDPEVQMYRVKPAWLRYSNYKDFNVWEHSF